MRLVNTHTHTHTHAQAYAFLSVAATKTRYWCWQLKMVSLSAATQGEVTPPGSHLSIRAHSCRGLDSQQRDTCGQLSERLQKRKKEKKKTQHAKLLVFVSKLSQVLLCFRGIWLAAWSRTGTIKTWVDFTLQCIIRAVEAWCSSSVQTKSVNTHKRTKHPEIIYYDLHFHRISLSASFLYDTGARWCISLLKRH